MDARRIRRATASLLALLLALWAVAAAAGQPADEQSFSFLVFGDTRIGPFVAAGPEAREEIVKLLRFKDPAELSFDPQNGVELVRAVEKGGKARTEYFFEDGWPRLMLRREGRKTRVLMRRAGREWVLSRILAELGRGAADPSAGPLFAVHTGDIVQNSELGSAEAQSPYWLEFNDRFLAHAPAVDPTLGLPSRFFPAIGNHELYGDPRLTLFSEAFPWLRGLGFSEKNRLYSFDFRGARFLFLDTGRSDARHHGFASKSPDFQGQMRFVRERLEDAHSKGLNTACVVLHRPVFSLTGQGGLPPGQNPHEHLKPFARDMRIVVFAGHEHTTERFLKDGIVYLTLGCGGAPMTYHTSPAPAGHPEELYWQGSPHVEEYNYALVRVGPEGLRVTLHRFRPGNAKAPFERIELVGP